VQGPEVSAKIYVRHRVSISVSHPTNRRLYNK